MTQQFPAPQPAMQPQHFSGPPKKPSPFKKPVVWLPVVAGFVGIFLGAGIGGADSVEAAPAPTPAPTVTVTAPPVEKKVTVEKTPAACIEYVNLSEQGFTYSAEAMGYMAEAMNAASTFNVAGITAATEKLDVLNPKLKALTTPMNSAKATCRAAG